MIENPGDPPSERESSRRRTLVLVLAITVIAAAITAGLVLLMLSGSGETPPSEPSMEHATIDPARFPRGALAGEEAPEIILALFDGSEFVLSEHLAKDGRPVVLNLWASWCTPCRREIPEFFRGCQGQSAGGLRRRRGRGRQRAR